MLRRAGLKQRNRAREVDVFYQVSAWFLYPGRPGDSGPSSLVLEDFTLSDIREGEILAEPLYGAWGANMNHALDRKPIDVCRHRGEERVILGNAGVVRVLEVGSAVGGLRPGQ